MEDTLEDFKASWLLGLATRVWRVRELDDHSVPMGPNLVLKDVWIDENALSEKEILDDIISKVNTVHNIGELEPDFASKYFVLISRDEQVELEIGNQLQGDCTTTILRGMSFQGVKALPVFLARQDDPLHRPVVSQSYLAATASLTGSSQIPGNSDNGYTLRSPPELKGYTAKQHRRILYTEFGVPLHSPSILTDHKRFFRSMGQVTRGNSLFSS